MRYGLEIGLVFVGGIFIWIIAFSFLLGLIFWPWFAGLGKNAWVLYLVGMGIITACSYGAHMYRKVAACGKNRMHCLVSGVGAGLGWGFLWPFVPFVWICDIYEKWEDRRSIRKTVVEFRKHFENGSSALKEFSRKLRLGKPTQATPGNPPGRTPGKIA